MAMGTLLVRHLQRHRFRHSFLLLGRDNVLPWSQRRESFCTRRISQDWRGHPRRGEGKYSYSRFLPRTNIPQENLCPETQSFHRHSRETKRTPRSYLPTSAPSSIPRNLLVWIPIRVQSHVVQRPQCHRRSRSYRCTIQLYSLPHWRRIHCSINRSTDRVHTPLS